jgi:hypothetical protein
MRASSDDHDHDHDLVAVQHVDVEPAHDGQHAAADDHDDHREGADHERLQALRHRPADHVRGHAGGAGELRARRGHGREGARE